MEITLLTKKLQESNKYQNIQAVGMCVFSDKYESLNNMSRRSMHSEHIIKPLPQLWT